MQITKYHIKSEKIKKLRIALVSDLHDRPFDAVSAALSAEKTDIIALAGDITNKRMPGNLHAESVFKACSDIAPSFFCCGNHEWLFNEEDRELCEKAGVKYLKNEYINFNGIYIGGLSTGFHGRKSELLGDRHEPNTQWLKAFSEEDGFKLLISHHPDYYTEYIKELNIDLTVSGHAHGGQIRVFNCGVYFPDGGFFPKYTKGVFENRLVVGAGLSNTARFVPRINNPTELVIVEVGCF